jgi:hypothetical protein
MKNKIIQTIFCIYFLLCNQTYAQQNTVATGGNASNLNGSFSYSIGQIAYAHTLGSSGSLNQGLQQPFELIVNVKAFLQGYYIGSGMMNDVLYNQGEYANPSVIADSRTFELHDATAPYALAFQAKSTIKQNGGVELKDLGVVGQSYYIVIKHRNSIETWSANPVLIQANTTYDFSDLAGKAYGSNQMEVESGVWAVYSGDVNQDYAIDAFDYLQLDPDVTAGVFGYSVTDLTGDGVVDSFDYLMLDMNLTNGIGAITP